MPEITYLSLGWGVRSWTIAAMAALEELPPIDLDAAIEAKMEYLRGAAR